MAVTSEYVVAIDTNSRLNVLSSVGADDGSGEGWPLPAGVGVAAAAVVAVALVRRRRA